MRVLLIDDDDVTLELVERSLVREGHHVSLAKSAREALTAIELNSYDLLVLDVMLGADDGLALCQQLRADGLTTPILFLSARGTVNARVDGLEAGGDDYLPKPFALKELVARVRTLGRRAPVLRSHTAKVGRVTLDFDTRRASGPDGDVPLTAREWDILRCLADAEGRVLTFDEVLEQVWGESTEGRRASMDVLVSRLRTKLDGPAGCSTIRTLRGSGYALECKP